MNARELHQKFESGQITMLEPRHNQIITSALDLLARTEESTDELVRMCEAASRDERLADGMLYRKAAAALVALKAELESAKRVCDPVYHDKLKEEVAALKADLAAAQEALDLERASFNAYKFDYQLHKVRMAQVVEAQEARQRAEADAESNRKDAERYRWLRGNGAIISRAAGIPVHLAHFGIGLDAAIDAAKGKP